MRVNTLKVMIRVLHSASLRLTEQSGRETTDKVALLELTWNCSVKRGKTFPAIDTSKSHVSMMKYMDVPTYGSTIPTIFYYAVWEEYAAAELYRKELGKESANLLGEYFRDINDKGYCSDDQYEGDDLYDSCITCRDADLVLAIRLEKASVTEGDGKPK